MFAGKRMLDGLLDGATPGALGTVTDNGWSNTEVFNKYMQCERTSGKVSAAEKC